MDLLPRPQRHPAHPDNTDILANENAVWTEHVCHVSHCLYAWERIRCACLAKDKLLPSEFVSLNHTSHCVGLPNEEQS